MSNRSWKWVGIALMVPMVAMVVGPLVVTVATLALLMVGALYVSLVETLGAFWWVPLAVIAAGFGGAMLYCRSVDALSASPGRVS